MKQRKIYECNYCGWVWTSRNNPKVCPKCHNDWNGKPKYNTKNKYRRTK